MTDSTSSKRNIDLHIEELVLDGFPAQDASRIASVVQGELERVLSQGNIPENITNGNITQIDGGTVRIRPGASPEMTGKQVAQNLYRGLIK